MTVQNKTIIKSYFESGDRPTQAQFADLIDSYQNANSNLTTLASASTGTVGLQLLATVTTVAAQNVLGGGTVGKQIFACSTTAQATNIIGGGDMTKAVYDAANINQQLVGVSAAQTLQNKIVITATASAASAGLRLPHGAAPFAPVDGDMWTTTSGLFARINSVTQQISAPQFTLPFTSSDQTITSSGGLTLPHSLGTDPKFVYLELICQTGEAGYSAGAVVRLDALNDSSCGVSYDSTNINIRFSSNASAFRIINGSSGAPADLTNANWKLRVKAWA